LDNPIATENLHKLIKKTGADYVAIEPNRTEYADILKSLFKASVENLAFAQDNLIVKALQEYGETHHLKYSLDGNNFAHESILERGNGVNFCDDKFIRGIHKKFGTIPLRETAFITLTDRYLKRKYVSELKHIRPLNYLPYDINEAIRTLEDFCGFQYYGGKHYESILTRFLQCYYLPVKFGRDKRKSHYSSLIISGQMTREEALKKLEAPLYPSEQLLNDDKKFLSNYLGVTLEEFEEFLRLPPKQEREYPHSCFNELAPLARKFRKFLE